MRLKPESIANHIAQLRAAIYAVDVADNVYLQQLRDTWAHPELGGPDGVCIALSACAERLAKLTGFVGRDPAIEAIARLALESMAPRDKLRHLAGEPLAGLVTDVFGASEAMRVSEQHGVIEFVGCLGPTGIGSSLIVGTPLRAAPTIDPNLGAALEPLAHHLAAAWRLRQRLATPDAFEGNAEVTLTPDGGVAEALGPGRAEVVRERLRRLVLAREHALQTLDGALWPALLDGRYTLLDRFDRKGTRYVVAYVNPQTASSLAPLTDTERTVLEAIRCGRPAKLLAEELETSAPVISTVLHRALRKLGIANAIELTLLAGCGTFVSLDDEQLGPNVITAFALRGPSSDALLALTPSERAVTADILRGLSNREIAAKRNRSERTVANQVARILQKMRVPTRRALAVALAS
ncbi:MAG: hypothetical protein RL701_7869 [Pseudomonadota bacterium]